MPLISSTHNLLQKRVANIADAHSCGMEYVNFCTTSVNFSVKEQETVWSNAVNDRSVFIPDLLWYDTAQTKGPDPVL